MSMKSLDLADRLAGLPGGPEGHRKSSRELLTDLYDSRPGLQAAETAAATSIALWAVLDNENVDDSIQRAYEAAYPGEAAQQSLYEKMQELTERGEGAYAGFINGIKGKMAEFNAAEELERAGYTNINIAADTTQPVWDISATSPDGAPVLWQVKTGGEGYTGRVQGAMAENPDVNFAVSSEIHQAIAEADPEAAEGLMDIGEDYELVAGVDDGLDIISGNLGIDIPEGVMEVLPYAGAIMASIRLLHNVISTERTFRAADRTTKNKIQVVQTLTLVSRMGLTALMSAAGGAGGSALGSVIPGAGNLVGGIAGTVTGGVSAMFLNRRLQPRILSLALDICGLEEEDLFYFKNKERVDRLALSFHDRAATTQARDPRRGTVRLQTS